MEKPSKQPQLGWATPKEFNSHAVIPNLAYRVEGLPITAQSLIDIAGHLAGMAQAWKNAEQLGQTVTTIGGLYFTGTNERDCRFFGLNSDLRIEFGEVPEFTWKDGDVLNPLHLRVDTFSSSPCGRFANRNSAGVRVIHLPTGLEAKVEGGRSAFANRRDADLELIRLLDKRFGVTHEVR